MKKIMIFSITLLPLIILLILTASGMAISLTNYIYVEDVEFVKESIVLQKTSDDFVNAKLEVNVFPMIATNKELIFYSGDENIVSVDNSGNISGVDFGETYVYVKSKENQTKSDFCKVTVTDNKIHKIVVENPVDSLFLGETYAFKATYAPLEADNPRLIWSSSDESIVEISPDGVVTVNQSAAGSAVITVYSEGNPNAKYSFTVYALVKVEGLTVEDESPVTVGASSYQFPEISVYPESADRNFSFSSSDEDIATVDGNGLVTFKQAGTVLISAAVAGFNGKVSKQITSTYGYLTSAVFSTASIETDFESGRLLDLTVNYTPADGDLKNLSYHISNEQVVYESQGKFYVKGGGTAVITATVVKNAQGETAVASCTVKVNRAAESIAFQDGETVTDFIVTSLKKYEIKARVLPDDATDKQLSYTVASGNVSLSGGVVGFLSENYSQAQIQVSAAGGIKRVLTLTYVPATMTAFEILAGENSISLQMPLSANEQTITFVAVVRGENIQTVELAADGGLTVDGLTVTAADKGEYQIGVKVNGTDFAVISLVVCRKVEQLAFTGFTALWTDISDSAGEQGGGIYTSAKKVEFGYTMYPANATLEKAEMSLEGDAAYIENNAIIFTRAGRVTLILSADGITAKKIITSTFGLLDGATEVAEQLTVNAGETIAFEDIVKAVSPLNADKANCVITVAQNAAVEKTVQGFKAVRGGSAVLNVQITTPDGVVTRKTTVNVNEQASGIVFAQNYIYTKSATVRLADKYTLSPSSSNYLTAAQYTLEYGAEYAAVSEGAVTFTAAGLAKVKVCLENGVSRVLTVIYSGDLAVINGASDVTEVKVNTPFIIMPDESTRNAADDDAQFDNAENTVVERGAIVTLINGAAEAQPYNAAVEFDKTQYLFKAVVTADNIILSAANQDDAHLTADDAYLTGLKELAVSCSVAPENTTYKELTFAVGDSDTAVFENGILKFKKAGTVTLKAIDKYGLQKFLTVTSTFGTLKSLTAEIPDEFVFDNQSGADNSYELHQYLTPYPAQVTLSEENIRFSAEGESISAENNILTLSGGGLGWLYIEYLTEDGFKAAPRQSVAVSRQATDIELNGVSAQGLTQTVELNVASYSLFYSALPHDANTDTDITAEIVSGGGDAELIGGKRLVFYTAEKEVVLRFSLASGKYWDIKYLTHTLSQSISVDGGQLIVPSGDDFSLYSDQIDMTQAVVTFTDISVVQNGANYNAADAGKGTVTIAYDNDTTTLDIIVTKRAEEIVNVSVADTTSAGEGVVVAAAAKSTHLTASKSVSVSAGDLGYALNADGTFPVYQFEISDSSVAKIDDAGVVTFLKAGQTNITIKVSGNDFYGGYTTGYTFTVKSTFGRAESFNFENAYKDGIVIDEIAAFSVADSITVTSPSYGVCRPEYTFESGNVVVLAVDGQGFVTVNGTGTATITVSTFNGSGIRISQSAQIKVDKYIDGIAFVSADGDTIYSDITQSGQYKISVALYSNTGILPTLNTLKYEALSGGATVTADGTVTFSADNTVCKIKVWAAVGNAGAQIITLTKVATTVKIIDVNESIQNENIVAEKGERCVFNLRLYNGASIDLNGEDFTVDGQTAIFSGKYGSRGEVNVSGADLAFTLTITEPVSEIRFNGLSESLYLTAQDCIDLEALYGAYIYPVTAMDKDGAYQLAVALSNGTGAAASDGVSITFTEQGTVAVTFSAGGKSAVRTVESTMGYAKTAAFSTDKYSFVFDDGSYQIKPDDVTITPSDATKQNLIFDTQDESIFTVTGNSLTFTGGGATEIKLYYSVSETEQQSIVLPVYVYNPVREIVTYSQAKQAGYIVSAGDFKLEISVQFTGFQASPYKLEYTSQNTDVATVDENGNITFLKSDTMAEISVSAVNERFNSLDTQVKVFVKKTEQTILRIENEATEVNLTLAEAVENESVVVYPVIKQAKNKIEITVLEGNDVVEASGDGLTIKKGGFATLLLSAKVGDASAADASDADWSKEVNLFIHRATTEIEVSELLSSGSLLTSKSTVDLSTALLPADSVYQKEVEYEYDSAVADIDDNGQITFKKAGVLQVVIKVKYEGAVEITKTVSIESTYGKPKDFKVLMNGENAKSEYSINDVGGSIKFTVADITPADFTGGFSVATSNTDAHGITVSGNAVTLKGTAKGVGTVTFKCGDLALAIKVNVLLKSKNVVVKYGQSAVTSLTTVNNTVTLSGTVEPLNASLNTIIWSADNGATVENGIVTFPNGQYGEYTVTAAAADGASSASVTINYLQSLDNFWVKKGTSTLNSNDTVYLEFNESVVNFTLDLSIADIAADLYNDIVCESTNGSTITRNGKYITVQTLSVDEVPQFRDVITFSYKEVKTVKINISRFGVQSVVFDNLDNATDINYGLQQMRLFGTKSYYDGASVDYYKMSITVKPASLAGSLIWETSNSAAGVSVIGSTAYVNFGSASVNSVSDIKNNIFEKGVTVSAKDDRGNVFYSYTFHLVDALNVFDANGFVSTDEAVVLHIDLGHDDEAARIQAGTCSRLESTSGLSKSAIYGNGHMINYAELNKGEVNEWDWIEATPGTAFNVSLKGANYNADSSNYHINFSGCNGAYYSEFFYGYKGIEAADGVVIKNCLFRNIDYVSIQINVDERKVYLENLIIYDGGDTAIESQTPTFYIKGFLDIYNFKSQSDLSDYMSVLGYAAMTHLKSSYPSYIFYDAQDDNEKYVNIAIAMSKSGGNKRELYFWDEASASYKTADNGNENAASGLKRMTYLTYSLWSYPNTHAYLQYTNQFSYVSGKRVENHTYLASQNVKLQRIPETPAN